MGDKRFGGVFVADVRWNGVNLTVLDWNDMWLVGEERDAHELGVIRVYIPLFQALRQLRAIVRSKQHRSTYIQQKAISILRNEWGEVATNKRLRLLRFREAARVNQQFATVLRGQGLGREADQFAYRSRACERSVRWQQRQLGGYVLFLLLDLVSGYGYKVLRSFGAYLLTIAFFAFLFWRVTNGLPVTEGLFTHIITWMGMTPPPSPPQHLQGYEAVVLSMASFHGRGFFQPTQSPGDKVAILAAVEGAVGLLLEIIFIATFTQRFFAR